MGGYTTDSTPRRRTTGATASDVRRRATTMGYSSKPDLQNNYAGHVPHQTNYGYSGSGVKKNSAVPMMMAGGAGLAAGALIGAGGYYAYSRMKNGNYQGHHNDRSWCRPNSNPSRTMLCYDCQQMTGNINDCEILDDCYRAGGNGCSYEIPSDTLRDDILTAGFVPEEYRSPFTITITKIDGEDYKGTNICPEAQPATGSISTAWVRASQIEQSLFMTLTEMTALDVTPLDAAAASAHHASVGVVHLLLAFILCRFFGRRA